MNVDMPMIGSGLGWLVDRRWSALRPRSGDPTPAHLQVARNLAHAIQRGEWRPNEELPSARYLSAKVRISRATARRALEVLAERNVVHRHPGSGFVVAPRLDEPQRKAQ